MGDISAAVRTFRTFAPQPRAYTDHCSRPFLISTVSEVRGDHVAKSFNNPWNVSRARLCSTSGFDAKSRNWPSRAPVSSSSMREFPKIRGTLFWGPYNKDRIIYYIRVPYFRKLPCSTDTAFFDFQEQST